MGGRGGGGRVGGRGTTGEGRRQGEEEVQRQPYCQAKGGNERTKVVRPELVQAKEGAAYMILGSVW